MRIFNSLPHSVCRVAIAVITIFFATLTAIADRSIEDQLDAILSGMATDEYTALAKNVSTGGSLEAYDAADYAALSAFVSGSTSQIKAGNSQNSPAASLSRPSVESALDYLINAYGAFGYPGGATDLSQGYGNGYNYPRPSRYAHLLPGSAVLPIVGRVSSGFGWRPRFGRMHKGTDISLHVGDTVVAAIDGRVTRVKNDPRGYGLYVCISHANGLETRYAHLSQILAWEGQTIYAGQPVGLGGSTGNSTGPHLHFEVRVNGEAIDATTMFDFSNPDTYSPYRTLADLDSRNPAYNPSAGNPYSAAGQYGSAAGLSQGDPSAGRYGSPYSVAGQYGSAVGLSQGDPAAGRYGSPYSAGAQYGSAAGLSQGDPAAQKKSTHIVRAGESIASIARKHSISVLTLCRLNGLSCSDALTPGSMLKLR